MAKNDTTKGDIEAAVEFKNFVGINNVNASERLSDQELRDALNVDIDTQGRISRREGYSQVFAGSNIRSLFAKGDKLYFAQGSTINLLKIDNTAEQVFDGVNPNKPVSFVEVNSEIYFSDGQTTGIIGHNGVRAWGLDTPDAPTLTAGIGSLPAGQYRVVLTYVSLEGEQSGAALGSTITLQNNQGIQISNIGAPQQSTVEFIRIYVTKPNGSEVYRLTDLLSTDASYLITNLGGLAEPLETQFLQPFPACEQLTYYRGSIYGFIGSMLYSTRPLYYGLYKPDEDLIPFAAPIKLIASTGTGNGIYVVADKTYFLSGVGPEDFQFNEVAQYSAPKQTPVTIPSEFVGTENVSEVLVWLSDKGFLMASPSGQLQNLTEKRIALPQYQESAIVFRNENGNKQVLTTSKNVDKPNAAAVKDEWSATIIRNGVVI